MPGTFVLKPIEANLTHNTELVGRMSPYCSVIVGNTKAQGEICKRGGKHPHWNDPITIPVANETKAFVDVMDKDSLIRDDNIGSFVVDLKEVQCSGLVSKWYPLTYQNKSAGEILIEASYEPTALLSTSSGVITGIGKNQSYEQEKILTRPPEVTQKQEIVTTTTTTTAQPVGGIVERGFATQPTGGIVEKGFISADVPTHSNVYTEQKQVIEPHKFVKEVEVVETRSAFKEIEVMEPVHVMKEVQYTRAVPVKKHIDVSQPQVVMKEVGVMEPRLVTKTIQVIENVPVKRQVEVIEMHNAIQEVETLEPQTFHKQVEVTEFVPVHKQIEVTQPVTFKKAVEYVEPVITTQTITKELHEPVIVNEETTTSVGPASVIGVSREYGYVERFGEMSISEQQRLAASQRWFGYEAIFYGLNDNEKFLEQQRLSRLSEQEWSFERQRLLGMSPQDRMLEQRRLLGFSQKGATVGSTSVTGVSRGYGYAEGFGGTTISEQQKLNASPRWTEHELIFDGLNENERFYEQQRLSRLNEQELLYERQRLLGMNPQDRLIEQRRLLGFSQKGMSVGTAPVTGVSRGYEYAEGFGGTTISEQQKPNVGPRWNENEAIFSGLNDTEKFYEQQRLSRLSEQEWIYERQRLLAMSPHDRLVEQRKLFRLSQKAGGYSSYIDEMTVSGLSGGVNPIFESKKYTKPPVYHPSPNF